MAKDNWFSTWFDTTYYHTLYKNRDYSEAEQFIDRIVNHLTLPESAQVLDLACGKGRHSITLFTHGFEVLGVDLSANSIEEAKKFANDRLHFHVHDMRTPVPNDKFDCVFNLFTSFGYFENIEDNLKVLMSIEYMLKKNGRFVIDFMNAKKAVANLVPFEIKSIDGIDFHISKKLENGFIVKTIEFEDNGEKFSYQERVQALTIEHFRLFLEKVGLKITEIFGEYSLTPFNEDSSNRLIIIGEKK